MTQQQQPELKPQPASTGEFRDLPIEGEDGGEVAAITTGEQEVLLPGAIIPQPPTVEVSQWQVMREIAANAVQSRIYARLTSTSEALARILAGRELGLGPSASLANLYVVNGRVGMGAALIGALIKKSGRYDYTVKTLTDSLAEIVFTERDKPIGTSTFTMQDALKAGVLDRKDSPWAHYPRNMLLARALTNGARWYCPDVFHGAIYTPEELDQRMPTFGGAAVTPGLPAGDSTAPGNGSSQPGELVRTPYAPTNGDDEPCPLHWSDEQAIAACKGEVRFFKRGKMRSHAHPLTPDKSGRWCNRYDVADVYRNDLSAALKTQGLTGDAGGVLIKAAFPDIATVPTKEWRLVDWRDAVAFIRAYKGAPAQGAAT